MYDLWPSSSSGQQYQEGQAVYPDQDTQSTGVFPDGTTVQPEPEQETPLRVCVEGMG